VTASNYDPNRTLNTYKVTFEDGKSEKVPGRWPAHAWAVAQNMRPNHPITGLELVRLGAKPNG
jgi:hypothetical protein